MYANGDTLREYVRAGIKLLDETFTDFDWRKHIDTEILELGDPDYCIFGQLRKHVTGKPPDYANYSGHLGRFAESVGIKYGVPYDYTLGFEIDYYYENDSDITDEMLREAWKEELEKE